MEHRKRIAPVILLILLIIGGYYLYANGQWPFGGGNEGANVVSGFIEGEEITIAAEIGGRVEALLVDEGDRVTAGQELLHLDRSLLNAQLAQAQATVDLAKAQLAQVKAGARSEEIRQAEAALAQAIALRDGAKKSWENAQLVRDNPQELDARITAAQAQVEIARHQLQTAIANAKAAEVRKDAVGGVETIRPEGKVIVNQWWAAEEAVQVAQAALQSAEKGLEVLLDMRARPLTLNVQVDAAKAQYDAAIAAVAAAQARLDVVKAGASPEQVAVAEAVVRQAEAALGVLQTQAAKLTLKSPVNGRISRRTVHLGELAAPGTPLLAVTNLDTVKLTVYVPETQIGRVNVGDAVAVRVDAFPGRVFPGKIVFLATQAEFTPRNVQTKAERVNMVFAVKVQIANPGGELKPGMPADATLTL